MSQAATTSEDEYDVDLDEVTTSSTKKRDRDEEEDNPGEKRKRGRPPKSFPKAPTRRCVNPGCKELAIYNQYICEKCLLIENKQKAAAKKTDPPAAKHPSTLDSSDAASKTPKEQVVDSTIKKVDPPKVQTPVAPQASIDAAPKPVAPSAAPSSSSSAPPSSSSAPVSSSSAPASSSSATPSSSSATPSSSAPSKNQIKLDWIKKIEPPEEHLEIDESDDLFKKIAEIDKMVEIYEKEQRQKRKADLMSQLEQAIVKFKANRMTKEEFLSVRNGVMKEIKVVKK